MTVQPPFRSFFSVRHDLVLTGAELPYDLFVNSSALKEKEKFVRIFPAGDILSADYVLELHQKYIQLYVAEDQRSRYLHGIVQTKSCDDVTKVTVLKDSALEYLHRIFDKDKEFSTELLSAGIEGCREVVEGMVSVLDDYGIDDLRGLIGSLSFHDFYTYDHSINVSMYCITLYKKFFPNATRLEIVHAGLGGLLHDLGKIKIPTHILNNPGNLTEEEYGTIKKHPDFGLGLLLMGEVKVNPSIDVKTIARVVHEHHENWDGTGYPAKLKGEEIHLMARVCTIADFFDAITTKRSYNQVLHVADALNVMRKFRAVKLDPDLYDKFEQHVHHLKADVQKDLRLADSFDPTLPYKILPIEEIKQEMKENFGKIRFVDNKQKKS